MTKTENKKKIDFKPIELTDKSLYESFYNKEERIEGESERGCEFTFANLYLWGRQSIATVANHAVILAQFGKRNMYPFPVGTGDKKAVIDAIIEDAEERGIPCRITGLTPSMKRTVEELYPDKFSFHSDEGWFDYIYTVSDLADLAGKKYHSKRNHLNRFIESHPNYTVQPISEKNIKRVKDMADGWYAERISENPEEDFGFERAALEKALRDYRALEMEGLVLVDGERVLAFTLANRLSEDTFDVNFEKALSDVQGAYTAINCEFARYIRDKYPSVRYIDREEDMGLEGLRKAKRSYHPHRMVKKFSACL